MCEIIQHESHGTTYDRKTKYFPTTFIYLHTPLLFSACRVVSLSYYLFVPRKENKVVNILYIALKFNGDHVYNVRIIYLNTGM